ncbi:MAG TPA: hypothetical protein VGB53_00315 [Rubricoccaceae bacterium]|jgi:hypothetical protein
MDATQTGAVVDTPAETPLSPRSVRHLINRFEGWYAVHRHRYTLGLAAERVAVLDDAVTADHAWALAHLGRLWLADADRLADQITAVSEADDMARLAALDDALPVDHAPARAPAPPRGPARRVAEPGLFTADAGTPSVTRG